MTGQAGSEAGRSLLRAVQNHDWDATAEVIETEWAALITTDSDLLKQVLRSLPPSVTESRPRLALAANYVSYLPVDGQTRTEIFRSSAPTAQPATLLDRLAELTSRAASKRSSGDFARAAADAQSARAALAEASDAELDAMQHALPELHYQWALALDLAGEADDALREYTESFDRAVMVDNLPIQLQAGGSIAWWHAVSGRRADATRWLARLPNPAAADWAARAQVPSVLATAILEVHDLRKPAALDRLGPVAEKPEYWAHRLYVKAQAAHGEAETIEVLAEIDAAVTARPQAMSSSGVPGALVSLARAKLLLKRGSIVQARAILGELVPGNAFTAISGRVLAARAAVLVGEATLAARTLGQFADLAAVHPFVHAQARFVSAVISSTGREHEAAQAIAIAERESVYSALAVLSREHLDEVMSLVDHVPDALPRIQATVDSDALERIAPLTTQELAVLGALADAGSVRGAATTLFISLNTAKSHLRRVYLKLGVNSKDEAIAVASSLGLLGG